MFYTFFLSLFMGECNLPEFYKTALLVDFERTGYGARKERGLKEDGSGVTFL